MFRLANLAKNNLQGYLKTFLYYTTITEISHVLILPKKQKGLTLVKNYGMINIFILAYQIIVIARLYLCLPIRTLWSKT